MRRAAPVALVACALGACGVENWSFNAVVDSGEGGSAAHAEASNGGCTSDVDCILASLHCDGRSGQCVACVTDTQCIEDGHGLKRCDSERCVQCGNNEDCYSGYACQPTSYQCVPSCVTDQECPRDAPHCTPRGLCVACTDDQDCAGAGGGTQTPLTCDLEIGQCAQCRSDLQCRGDQRCDQTIDRCVGCLSSVDCDPNEVCDPDREMCTGPLDASTRDTGNMADATTGH